MGAIDNRDQRRASNLSVASELMENTWSTTIIAAAIEVHRHLGPGLLESAYETALARELTLREIAFSRQVCLPVEYKGVHLDDAYRIDLLVGDCVVVEIKAVKQLLPVHEIQLLTYLRFSGRRLGLLLNFHAATMKSGIKRIANGL